MSNGILLESGNGELEIIEFIVNGVHYAINVVKVKEVIEMPKSGATPIPNCKKEIAGVILSRGEILTLVDLKYVLTQKKDKELGNKIIVCEFNKTKVAFGIDDILSVKRIKWSDIVKPNEMFKDSLAVGNIVFDNRVVVMLDFEKIITDISPNTGISEDRLVNVEFKDRSSIRVVLVDDSPTIRSLIKDNLQKSGFNNLKTFDDGVEAYNYLNTLKKDKGTEFREDIDILITDIEMPQMDGLTLTRKIKEDPILSELPVIIFSSLITYELRHKAEEVKANAQLSKPEIGMLVMEIDKLLNI